MSLRRVLKDFSDRLLKRKIWRRDRELQQKIMETGKLSKYGKTTREERRQYYRKRIEELTPPNTDHDRSMIQIFEELMEYVRQTAESE